MVVCFIVPCLLGVPSTFRTGMGFTRVLSVRPFFWANEWLIMIPSAPLSRSARAPISSPDFFPTSVTLSVIEGERLFRIVSRGTGSESTVSSRYLLTIIDGLVTILVLIDSAAIGRSKNPSHLERKRGG